MQDLGRIHQEAAIAANEEKDEHRQFRLEQPRYEKVKKAFIEKFKDTEGP